MYRKSFTRLITLAVLSALLLTACAQPMPIAPAPEAAAPSGEQAAAGESAAAPGEIVPGGVWTRILGADASNLNPILYDDSSSSEVLSVIYPSLIGQDPVTGALVPDGSISESWSTSEDGLTWTFKLRDGITWSDGDPVDSADFKFSYDAIASDVVESPREYVWDQIESIETPDPLTVVVTFKTVKCDALTDVGLGLLPSHLYAADFSDVTNSPDNEAPRVSAGPFNFQSWTRDDNVIVVRNDSYWEGAPHMDGMIYKVVPDAGARLAQLQSGEVDISGLQPSQITAVEGNPDITRYSWLDDGYTYIGINLANPDNPQPGRDENGTLIPQDPHPILGDVKVRQAIAHALDYDSIIEDIFFGQGYRLPANVLPAIDWAYNSEIEPYAFDLEMAKSLLEEAGWVDGDGDGVREKDGVALDLSLVTNSSNSTRMDLGAYVQDQLNSIGFNIDFQGVDFGTLLEQLDGQATDMYIIGWTGLGSDPNDKPFWHSEDDVPGSGFNSISYQNERLEELLTQGYSVPGCKPEDRGPIYKEIQQIIHDDLPYIFVTGTKGNIGYRNRWGGLDPQPWSYYYNVHQWYDKSLQP